MKGRDARISQYGGVGPGNAIRDRYQLPSGHAKDFSVTAWQVSGTQYGGHVGADVRPVREAKRAFSADGKIVRDDTIPRSKPLDTAADSLDDAGRFVAGNEREIRAVAKTLHKLEIGSVNTTSPDPD
jgi:hypothetical protein